MKNIKFYFLICIGALLLIPVCLLSSCGLVGQNGNRLGRQDSGAVSNAGDGATPQLKSRIEANPRLAKKKCEDYDSCEDTCKKIYEEKDSRDTCYNLSVGRASELEEVYVVLLNAKEDKLEDIDTDHLEKYLEVGLDGVLEKVIPQIEEQSSQRANRLKNLLQWIVEEDTVVSVLKSEDRDNAILEGLILAHCNINSDHKCANSSDVVELHTHNNLQCQIEFTWKAGGRSSSIRMIPNLDGTTVVSLKQYFPNPNELSTNSISSGYVIRYTATDAPNNDSVLMRYFRDGSGINTPLIPQPVILDYNNGDIYICNQGTAVNSRFQPAIYKPANNNANEAPNTCTPSSGIYGGEDVSDAKPCASLTKKLAEVEEEEKELFIALAGAGQVFFEKSADEDEEEAFALGHDLLNKACNAGSSTSKSQCKASFYCFLWGSGANSLTQAWFDKADVKEALLDEEVDLKACNYGTTFTAL